MNRERFHYNAENQVTQYQDAADNTTQIEYQGLPFATKRTHADGHSLSYQYDSELNLTALVNENKQKYQLHYDDKERLIEEIGFDGNSIKYQYAPNDFLTQKQDGKQAWQQHVRDPLGRLKQILYQDGQQTEFEYDEQGRLTKAQNGQHTTEFQYNAEHQLCAQVQDGVKVEYDTGATHHSLILPDGKNITYHIGEQHKLSHISVDDKTLSSYEYDEKGFEVKQTLGAMELLQQYDPYGRLIEQRGTSLFASGMHNTTLSSRRYLYDKAGRIAQIQRQFGGYQTFQYDNRNRLAESDASDFSHQYQFDAASNLVLEPKTPQESNPVYTLRYTTGDNDSVDIPRILNNQLPENHKQDVRYRYDERGNRITASYGNGIVQTRYQYDTQNQLIQLENITGTHTTQKLNFTYDALGRRCAKYVTTYSNNCPIRQYRVDFLWDGDVLLAEQKVELDIEAEPEKHPKPGFDKPDAIYIHRPNSFEPLMQLRQPEPKEIPKEDYLPKPTYSVYYYLNDHLGTPQELLNKRGELVWQARTSPYGEILKLTHNKVPNPIRLPGQYEDSESGLYYNRFRYYSPQDGGYINRDPIGLLGGFNLYDYPRNPISWVDPFGLAGTCIQNKVDGLAREIRSDIW